MTTAIKGVWLKLLEDLDDDMIQAAVIDLCSTDDWPPPVSKVRMRAIELSEGELAPASAFEAWERVCRSPHDDTVVLSDIEQKALNQIGGTWGVKNGNGNTINHFVRAYEALTAKQRRLRSVVPAVAGVAASNAPALPSPVNEKPLTLQDGGHEMGADPAEVKELLKGVVGYEPVTG